MVTMTSFCTESARGDQKGAFSRRFYTEAGESLSGAHALQKARPMWLPTPFGSFNNARSAYVLNCSHHSIPS